MKVRARRHRPKTERFRSSFFKKQTPRARSGRLPWTLAEPASTPGLNTTEAAETLEIMAAAIHFRRPCYAQFLQRVARQLRDNKNGPEAVTAWAADKPWMNKLFTERTFAERTFTEKTFVEKTFVERTP